MIEINHSEEKQNEYDDFEKLQYNELKDIVKSYCVSGLGKELINKLEPSTSIKVVRNRLNETN